MMLRTKMTTVLLAVVAAGVATLGLMVPANAATTSPGATGTTSAVRPLATYLWSEEFWDANYGGHTLNVQTTVPCTNGGGVSTLVPLGWNDAISSYMIGNGCYENHYEDINYGGAQTGYQSGNHSYIGNAMNDRTSSMYYY